MQGMVTSYGILHRLWFTCQHVIQAATQLVSNVSSRSSWTSDEALRPHDLLTRKPLDSNFFLYFFALCCFMSTTSVFLFLIVIGRSHHNCRMGAIYVWVKATWF
ncbi:hypothetical protein REPUB_Repub05bG0141000 [Reevesia pubescens]